ncbi:hypothetical protein [Allocoleopsis sp.]|uniref:hypothetical protein n=1 Tax=Allocoleopsis sp. TaxID=3088169 RepID=UPI002FD1E81C
MTASTVRFKDRNFVSKLSQQVSRVFLGLSVLAILMPQLTWAQTSLIPAPSFEPLDTKLLEQKTRPPQSDWVTASTISPTSLTNPSLWWAEEQFNEFDGKLIENWIAYQDKKRVDLVVNRQLWTLLDYLGRYSFLSKYGTAARDYQYNVRVFNDRSALLATYTCNYSTTLPDCQLKVFDSFGRDSLPARGK